MDNASIHKANVLREFFSNESLNVKFISPYSYMLNPIEFSFSKIKSVVKRILTNSSEEINIVDVIYRAVSEITSNDLEGYYRLIRINCTKAIAYENFN
jgi:transposase